jgi:hypothetical protein
LIIAELSFSRFDIFICIFFRLSMADYSFRHIFAFSLIASYYFHITPLRRCHFDTTPAITLASVFAAIFG